MKINYLFPVLGLVLISGLTFGKDSVIPVMTADAQHSPALPNTRDLYTLKYKAVNADAVDDLARLVRSFTPPTSQIIPYQNSGVLLVTDTAASLKKVYGLIKENDVKPTPEMKAKWQEIEKQADQQMGGIKHANELKTMPTPSETTRR